MLAMKVKNGGVTGREDGRWYATFYCPVCGAEKYAALKSVWGAKKYPAPQCYCSSNSPTGRKSGPQGQKMEVTMSKKSQAATINAPEVTVQAQTIPTTPVTPEVAAQVVEAAATPLTAKEQLAALKAEAKAKMAEVKAKADALKAQVKAEKEAAKANGETKPEGYSRLQAFCDALMAQPSGLTTDELISAANKLYMAKHDGKAKADNTREQKALVNAGLTVLTALGHAKMVDKKVIWTAPVIEAVKPS